MKKFVLLICVLSVVITISFAEEAPNYQNGNGTIIYENEEKDTKVIIRKCEVEVIIGDLASFEQRIIYENYISKKPIGKLHDNDECKILQVYRIDHLKNDLNKWNEVNGELWYKIACNSITGWICISSDYIGKFKDPYYNNRWEIIDVVKSGGKKWTVRTMEQELSVWNKLEIRDNPGISGNKVLYTIKPNVTDPYQTNVEVLAITEEVETIDGTKDHWLKIKYNEYTGWIFGGYTTAERGGPKYYIPESIIEFDLGWNPNRSM